MAAATDAGTATFVATYASLDPGLFLACVSFQVQVLTMTSKKILVTGANGFVGQALCNALSARDYIVRGAVRQATRVDQVSVGDIGPGTEWGPAIVGVAAIVHAAARVHVMNDSASNPLHQYREVNVDGSLNLARQAASAKVKRFVFISSIKVNGESTLPGQPFTTDDSPDPEDAYGISKWEAETGLLQLANETAMEVVIIRPPLVYGPGVKANFRRMMRWLDKGVPLPLGNIQNRRSLVALDNLVDLIITCIEHPAAANQIFLAGDGEDLSTTELLKRIGDVLGKPARLFPCPSRLLTLIATLLGKQDVAQRLCGSLQVDISKARDLLGWEPPVSVEEGLRKVAEDFMKNKL